MSAELGELIQEQHAAVGEGDLARLGNISTTDKTRVRNCVMRCPEGTVPDQRHSCRKLVCYRVDPRYIQ